MRRWEKWLMLAVGLGTGGALGAAIYWGGGLFVGILAGCPVFEPNQPPCDLALMWKIAFVGLAAAALACPFLGVWMVFKTRRDDEATLAARFLRRERRRMPGGPLP